MKNYFKVARRKQLHFFHFDGEDRESIEVAWRDAVGCAFRLGGTADDVSVFAPLSIAGAWSRTRFSRGVAVIRGEFAQGPIDTTDDEED